MTAEPLIFDSAKQQITPKHVLATTAYPTYFFQWIELEKGLFAWDGSLLSNTPLREVIEASPVKDKRIFLVENYPKNIESFRQPYRKSNIEQETSCSVIRLSTAYKCPKQLTSS